MRNTGGYAAAAAAAAIIHIVDTTPSPHCPPN